MEKVIRATQFVLEDENGNHRASLGLAAGGSRLNLSDENGTVRAMLHVFKNGPVLSLFDEKGKTLWSQP
ncbi:MAG: hypothetical protein ABSD56_12905 [Bryobacteraceae bacterium]